MTHTILLVDDSRTMRAVLRVYLMGATYEFIDAEDAARALDILRLVPVSLIIVDVNMPEMDGISFVRRVRASDRPAVRDVPIILITSDKADDLPAKSADARADAFLTKPVKPEVIAQIVRDLLADKAT
jgi:two-component system, chemotaxis family, chemotaxis protein CheY